MDRLLVVDGGRTGCRGAVFEHGAIVGVTNAPGLPHRQAGSLAPILESIDEIVLRAAADAGGSRTFDAVVLGLAAVDTTESFDAIASHVRQSIRTARLIVAVDAVLHYWGALGTSYGAVIAAGTGAIAIARGEHGGFERADGWGFMLGDDGSAYWVGRQGLAHALRTLDGRDSHPALAAAARRQFGALEGLWHRVEGSVRPVESVASFAPTVAELAQAGDPTAIGIYELAGAELGKTLSAAIGRVFGPNDNVRASWAGGLFSAGDILVRPFENAVRARVPGVQLSPPAGDALLGGSLMAAEISLPLAPTMLHEFAGPVSPP